MSIAIPPAPASGAIEVPDGWLDARAMSPARRVAALAFLLVAYFFYAWSWNTVDILRP